MANLSKRQVADIIKNAPQGTSPAGIVSALRQKGHILEGYALPEAQEKPSSLLNETVKGLPKAAAQVLLDPAAQFIGSAVKAPVDIVRGFMGKAPLQELPGRTLPSGAKAETIQSRFATKTLPSVQSGEVSPLMGTLDVAGTTALGAADTLGAGALIEKGGSALVKGVQGVVQNVSKAREIKAANNLLNEALDITSPKVTKELEEIALKQGRVSEGGILKKTKIAPTEQDKVVAESVQGIVKKSAKPQENVNAINQQVSRINSDVKEFVRNNKVPFNEAQLRTKLNVVKDENRLIFASDPNVKRTVDAAIDEFVSNVKSLDTAGLLEARQNFDKIPAVKKLLQSEKLGENVKREVVLGVRRAANEYVSDLLPANNPYKALLRQETNMIRAAENIAEKSTGRAGKRAISIFLDKHPLIKKALPWLVGTTGAGVVVTN